MMRSIAIGLVLVIVISSYSFAEEKRPITQGLQVNKDPQVGQIRPKKPLRIKLHRNAKGEYNWDITGDNVDDIVRADARLRRLLKLD